MWRAPACRTRERESPPIGFLCFQEAALCFQFRASSRCVITVTSHYLLYTYPLMALCFPATNALGFPPPPGGGTARAPTVSYAGRTARLRGRGRTIHVAAGRRGARAFIQSASSFIQIFYP